MKRPSIAALEQRIQDIITGVYYCPFDYEDHGFIFHMGDAKEAQRAMMAVQNAFEGNVNAYGQEKIAVCQCYSLQAWESPRTLAKAIRDHWKEQA